jgi:DNA mismatch repair protein MutS
MAVRSARAGARVGGEARQYGDLVRQYLELRDQHPGIILLFRIGTFYEALFEDAELVADALGLKLSDRPSGGSAPPVPQCGFTYHALDTYLPRLLAQGYRVAVCEEGESEGEGPRPRAVVRTLTPGTVTDPRLLREDRPTYLVAITATGASESGLAWTDVAAGEFKAGEFNLEEAAAEIQRLDPAEILVPSDAAVPEALLARRTVTRLGPSQGAVNRLRRAFPQAELADLPRAEVAAGLIVGYLEDTRTVDEAPPLEIPQAAGADDSMHLDAATQRHLELVETERGHERKGSLIDAIDLTITLMGRRMLRGWLLRPLTDLAKLGVRQRIIGELVADDPLRGELRARLQAIADLERLAGRAASRKTSLDDLRALAGVAPQLAALAMVAARSHSAFVRALGKERPALTAFAEQARATLAPPESEESIRPDADPALATAIAARNAALSWQTRYVEGLRRQPGLAKLKLERTSTQGLFLEVPANTAVPKDWIRRGGLAKVERYSTGELEAHAADLAEAEATIQIETRALLADLRDGAARAAVEARDLARRLAATDVLAALAEVAARRAWVLPVVDTGDVIHIEAGRHPVLEQEVSAFQPNDAHLEARGARDQLVVLTGPNMAGKSTWMREVALIVVLAQMGSFVPATSARIGIVDAIFTRIGAVDDLAAGRSTFMVEMLETASVLQSATDRSLVILDEIGRGTSTHDGMAIAWAVVEHLAGGPVRPRAIAATHYHELAALQTVYAQVTLLQATVEERPDGIVFPHRIVPGAADRSFGIEVARLAGLPPAVLDRARQVADALEPMSAGIAQRLSAVVRSAH